MSDPTRGVPVAGGPPPPGPPPPGPPPPGPPPSGPLPPGPGDDRPDRRLLYAIAALLGVIVLLVIVLLLVRAEDDTDAVATVSTTTTSTSTSTSSTTTTDSSSPTTSSTTTPPTTEPSASTPTTSTTAPPTTTTTEPPVTIAPRRCQGRTGPDDPDTVAVTFYDAWTVDDRACAEKFATEEAVDTLFMIDGSDARWDFQECTIDEQTADRDTVCSFRYEGGTALFALHRVPVDGWELYDVDFRAD